MGGGGRWWHPGVSGERAREESGRWTPGKSGRGSLDAVVLWSWLQSEAGGGARSQRRSRKAGRGEEGPPLELRRQDQRLERCLRPCAISQKRQGRVFS